MNDAGSPEESQRSISGEASGERWSSDAILTELGTKFLASELYLFDSATSTNDLALEHGLRGGREGALFLADSQTGGRGRGGNAWHSPPDCGIYASALLHPAPLPEHFGLLGLMVGVALVEGINSCGDFHVGVKWPNDLMIDGRKVGGILCELQQTIDKARFVAVGFGINVTQPVDGWPDGMTREVVDGATVLCADGRPAVTRTEVLRACLRRLDSWYRRYRSGEIQTIVPAWRRHATGLREVVEVRSAGEVYRGMAHDIDSLGALLLETPEGVIERVFAGELQLVPLPPRRSGEPPMPE